jgi:hypothetical protein
MSSSNDQVATADGDGAAIAENQVGQGDEVRTFLSINIACGNFVPLKRIMA